MSKITRTHLGIVICLAVVIILIINVAYIPSTSPQTEEAGMIASPSDIRINKVQREIQISEFGMVVIHENVTIRNIGSSHINGCELFHPQTHVKKVGYLMAFNFINNTELRVSTPYTRKGKTYQSISFDKVIQSGDTYQFKLTTVFSDCVTLDRESSYYTHVLDLEIPLYPSTPYAIDKTTVRVKFYEELEVPQSFYTYSPHADAIKDKVLHYDRLESKAYEIEMLKVTYYSELPPCVFTSAKRTIEFDPWGFIHITEEQTLKNIGMETSFVSQLRFFVPLDAFAVEAHDSLGNLTLSLFQLEDDYVGPPIDMLNGTIDTRVRLTGNHSYTFTLSYRLNLENHTRIENGRYILSTSLYTLMNVQIDSLDVNLILPEGCHLEENHSCNTTDSYLDFTRRVYRLKTDERGAAINSVITLSISVPIISMAMRPLFITFIFSIISTALISLRTLSRTILPTKIPVPREVREIVERFCRQYELRIAYRIDMGRLSRQKRLREIEMDKYIRERGKLTHKLDKIENELEVVKTEMLGLGEKYQDIITSIERLEEERSRANEMTITALRSFKRKDIHKTAFDRIVRKQRLKTREADNEIDRILLALREEYL